MAKQLVTYVWCDNEARHGEDRVEGRPRSIAIDGGPVYETDLCDPCDAEILGPVRALLDAAGQPLMQTPPPAKRTRRVNPENKELQTCPDCGKEGLVGLQGLGSHRSRSHGYISPYRIEREEREARKAGTSEGEETLDLGAAS